MRIKTLVMMVFVTATIAGGAQADTIIFRNGAVLEGRMLGSDNTHVRFESNGTVGNYSRDDVVAIDIGTLSETTQPPNPDPENLDVPTAWQEGDPVPTDTTVPEVEPEQESSEAPPSQPMEDECGDAPSHQHTWVTGYWWWYTGGYYWVPGYWFIPPYPAYVYLPGYWHWHGGIWVYHRGGWGHPYDHVVIMYAGPRPVVYLPIFPHPHRIVVRQTSWNHHHHRHTNHSAYQSRASKMATARSQRFKKIITDSTARERYNERVQARKKKKVTTRRRKTSNVKSTRRAPSARKPRQTTRGTKAPKLKRSPSKPKTGSKPKASKPRSSSRTKSSSSSSSRSRSSSSRQSSGKSSRRRN